MAITSQEISYLQSDLTNPHAHERSLMTAPGTLFGMALIPLVKCARQYAPDGLVDQHGSRPAGSNPNFSVIPWGDQKLLTQQQIADVEAYVMQLNGTTWPAS